MVAVHLSVRPVRVAISLYNDWTRFHFSKYNLPSVYAAAGSELFTQRAVGVRLRKWRKAQTLEDESFNHLPLPARAPGRRFNYGSLLFV